ncbi:ATP-binding protein [Streptomyces sp. B21-097]|uniref:ATP-binding protein n=1 Tax=Streptomyces sp. B21-097 TaxID=3039414 RepID=UPI002FF410F3
MTFPCEKRTAGDPVPAKDARRVEEMRHLAADRLRDWDLHALVEDVELVVSELVTNALVHACGGEITFSLAYTGGTVHISATDGSTRRPQPQNPSPDAESGRGLLLVTWVASEHDGAWGVSEDGRSTWCSLKVPTARREG